MKLRPVRGSTLLITISCLGAAVAVWLLPATVEITTWTEAGPERLALLPSVSRLWFSLAAAVAGAVVLIAAGPNAAAQRASRARIVAPLSILWLWAVPFLPWLPDRAPILLVLAGPLRWLVGLAAVIGAVSAWASIRTWRVPRVPLPNRRAIFVGSLILYLAFGLRSLSTAGLEGDEPHYLIITHSLLVDRDLKIENNHARADYASFYEGELRPDYIRRGQDGAIYSIHGPGLPVLLLPGYALAGVRGAMLTVSVLAALAALAVFDVALLVGAPSIALLTWVGVCLTVPFVPHAWMLYPEIPCALIVAWAVLWLLSSSPSRSCGVGRAWGGSRVSTVAAHEVRRLSCSPYCRPHRATPGADQGDCRRSSDQSLCLRLDGLRTSTSSMERLILKRPTADPPN